MLSSSFFLPPIHFCSGCHLGRRWRQEPVDGNMVFFPNLVYGPSGFVAKRSVGGREHWGNPMLVDGTMSFASPECWLLIGGVRGHVTFQNKWMPIF